MSPKSDLRIFAKARRAACARACPDFAAQIAGVVLGLPPGAIVAGYAAVGDEADPAALMRALAHQGHPLALPRVVAKGMPLTFHAWQDGDTLFAGAFGIPEPLASAPVVTPDVLLVPLLAFDAAGNRLGHGGGFYDRSIAALPGITAVGIAFAGQQVESVPHGAHDVRLDAAVTEVCVQTFSTL